MTSRKHLGVPFLASIFVVLALSGCFGPDASSASTIRVGDRATYETGGLVYVVWISATSEALLPGGEQCTMAVIDAEVSARSEPSEVSRYTSEFCLDGSFLSIGTQPGWLTPEGVQYEHVGFTAPNGLLDGGTVMCFLICRTMGSAGFQYQTWATADQHLAVALTATDDPMTFRLSNIVTLYRPEGIHVDESIREFSLAAGPFPDAIEVYGRRAIPNEPETNHHYKEERRSFKEGTGALIAVGTARPVGLAIRAGIPERWERVPPEGTSPFGWSQARAVQLLEGHPTGLDFMADHPDAFLAGSSYAFLSDKDSGQREHLWVMMWKDGAAGLWAECHELSTGLGEVMVPVEECYEVHPFTSNMPQVRSDQPEALVSWEDAVAAWRGMTGDDAPIRQASWTTLRGWIGPGGEVPWDKLEESDHPWYRFNPFGGSLSTVPVLPAWQIEQPDRQRALPGSHTLLDPASGVYLALVRPAA